VRVGDLRTSWRSLRDDVRTIAAQVGRQDLLFVAGALAYAVLLAAIPFALLLASAGAYLLGGTLDTQADTVVGFLSNFVPADTAALALPVVRSVLADAFATRDTVGIAGLLLFAFFSTRLFGALRASLVVVFEIDRGRGIFMGKLFDLFYVVVGTVIVLVYLALNLLVLAGGETGVHVLRALGASAEVAGVFPYFLTRMLIVAFLSFMFAALYKFLPNRPVRWSSAWWGGLWCAALFETVRLIVFEAVFRSIGPSTLYSGSLAVLVVVVLWVYYASIVFLVGGAVAHAHHQRAHPARP
jgi:membrane protein